MFRNVLSLLLLILSVIAYAPHIAASSEVADAKWSYGVKDGMEHSVRTYLLVYEPTTDAERRISVISRCKKPYPAEGAYGTCSHSINVQPTNVDFTLTTGEDVAMIQFTWDAPVILATIEYGCCAGADTVKFYTEKGEYWGAIERYGVAEKANYNNIIARTFNVGNGTRYGETIYLLVQADNKETGFEAVVFEKGMKPKKIPVLLNIPEREKCADWHIEEFMAYGDRQDIMLKLMGIWCPNAKGVQEHAFSCTASEKTITCLPEALKKKKGAGAPTQKDVAQK